MSKSLGKFGLGIGARRNPKDSRSRLKYLENLFLIVRQFYFSEQIEKEKFEQLSKVEKKLLFFLLEKLFQKEVKSEDIDHQKMVELQTRPSKKRNEEKIKQIWKRFLRKIYQEFKQKENRKALKKGTKPLDQWRQFYLHIAEDLTREKPQLFNVDVVMDVCTEKTINLMNSKKKGRLAPHNNWASLGKISAMKKISASFRFLVSQSREYSKEFHSFLDLGNPRGILKLMKSIIDNKLGKLFYFWDNLLSKSGGTEEAFIGEVRRQIGKKKFKLPWLISNVRNSVEHCLKDIEHEKLRRKFRNILKHHYSFSGSGDK